MPDQVRPGVWPHPRGTGTQPITVQAICCCGCRFTGRLVFAVTTDDAAINSAKASARPGASGFLITA